MNHFAVVLESYDAPPPEKLSALFQMLLGLPKLDANQWAGRVRGIVAEELTGDAAQRLQLALGNLKHPARVVPQGQLPEAVRGRRVQLLLVEPQRLGIRWTITGQVQFYPWNDVHVISAGVVFRQSSEQFLETTENWNPLNSRHIKETTTEVKRRDTSRDMAMAAITLRTPQGHETARLRAPEMEYATMLGASLGASPLQNFCRVLARLGLQSTTAHITQETVELITAANASPRLPRTPRFDSEEEFDQYQRWLVVKSG